MAELEALKRMREMAYEWSGTNVLMSVLDAQGSNMDDAAAIQEQAIDLVDALILRMQEAEANPCQGVSAGRKRAGPPWECGSGLHRGQGRAGVDAGERPG